MDLSGLSSNLPCARPSSSAVDEVNTELTNEFKNAAKSVAALYNSASPPSRDDPAASAKADFANAAKSVTALYRLTNNALGMVRHRGYADCLDDLYEVLARGEDLENWVLAKRAEVSNQQAAAPEATAPTAAAVPAVADLPPDYQFSFASDLSPPQSFRPSFPPLSVTHSNKQRNPFKYKNDRQLARKLKKHQLSHHHSQSSEDIVTSEEDIDEVDDGSEGKAKRRKMN
ncbi:Uncharacterized protein ABC855_g630 [[Candida] zeylanoides]